MGGRRFDTAKFALRLARPLIADCGVRVVQKPTYFSDFGVLVPLNRQDQERGQRMCAAAERARKEIRVANVRWPPRRAWRPRHPHKLEIVGDHDKS